ncbi:MAG: DUF4153 domain-containing protein [Thermonemataceae bacterium]
MKWIPIATIASQLRATIVRFPYVSAITLIGTLVAWLLVKVEGEESAVYVKLLLTLLLSLPLFLSVALYIKANEVEKRSHWLIRTPSILFLVIYYFLLPNELNERVVARLILFALAFHLLVSFIPFTKAGYLQAFWQFNKALFMRLILGGLYSFTLFTGVALAILAVGELFNLQVNGDWYLRLFIVVVGSFNTFMFLAGIPSDWEALNGQKDYPRQLKLFTQYVLLPLVALYLIILYAYTAYILILWDLPKGWVSYLVISFSIAGILSLLLVYPIRKNEGNQWINIFSKSFYVALFPLLLLLFVGIGKRIVDYGVTENRYFIVALACWLLGMAFYFLFSKASNIKIIPVTLFLVCLFSSLGPWSAFSVAERSQRAQLRDLINAIQPIPKQGLSGTQPLDLDRPTTTRIISIVRFFEKRDALKALQPLFKADLEQLWEDDTTGLDKSSQLLALIGVDNYPYGQHYRENTYTFQADSREIVDTRTYQLSFQVDMSSAGNQQQLIYSYPAENFQLYCHYELGEDKNQFLFFDQQQQLLAEIPFNALLKELAKLGEEQQRNGEALPLSQLTLLHQTSRLQFKIIFQNLSMRYSYQEKVELTYGNALILVGFPEGF